MVKKVLKITGIIVLILILIFVLLTVYSLHKPAAPDSYWNRIDSTGAVESRYLTLGPYAVQTKKYEAPQDESDKADSYYQVWYPEEAGVYPLVVMVNGTGVPCNKYEAVFQHFASFGYVVIGNNYGTNWDGRHASETLQFALDTEEIASMIDPDKIAIGGHSQGGMGTFNAITEYDNGALYKAAFSLSPTNDELAIGLQWGFDLGTDQEYAFRLDQIQIPMLIAAGTGSFDSETVSPLAKMQEEFSSLAGDKVIFRRSDDVDHGAILYEVNGYVIAWLDYYLKGVSENESAFYGDGAELSENPRYQDYQAEMTE
ncbi:MAG: chlorophyllase/cutinase-like alpha/beta fold protein [Lachnospiraceae bacterium]|jgi:dienelactone hydrolase